MLGFLYRLLIGCFKVIPPCDHRFILYKEYKSEVVHDPGTWREHTSENVFIVSRCEICGKIKKDTI